MKTWFITGASRGLGRALADAALERGDTVIGTVRGDVRKFDLSSGRMLVLSLDVTDSAAVAAAVDAAFGKVGRIDVLVNNAGYGLLGAIEEATDAEVDRLFRTNVFGPFSVIRAALPHLRQQRSGRIINVTSIAGRAPMASSGMYAAAKAAVEGMSQSLSQEVAPLGIKVTAVAPGGFRTDFLTAHSIRRSVVAEAYAASVGKAVAHLDEMAGRQIGDPARAASAILKLADASDPPLHLLLGSDALRRARERLDAVTAEIACWEEISRSTDFPKGM